MLGQFTRLVLIAEDIQNSMATLSGLKPDFPGRQPSVISIYHRALIWLDNCCPLRLIYFSVCVCWSYPKLVWVTGFEPMTQSSILPLYRACFTTRALSVASQTLSYAPRNLALRQYSGFTFAVPFRRDALGQYPTRLVFQILPCERVVTLWVSTPKWFVICLRT